MKEPLRNFPSVLNKSEKKKNAKDDHAAEPWQNKFPTKGHTQREVWKLMHGKICLRIFSRKQG